ncbi:PREDICTED: LOW QUALITY PROTEIN: putative F-box protein At2g16220 [Camelina sativa]|uniref:LOW QUALITY PROTEIN: putative F-box protein At2g16220 n=1 Tax=Camelina sativa TaxID=90675 RepID=A0ABM0ZCA7_CAMSA|nr:PREDICTED: LOW QUALITY PROTEIN: putative F-box protein At2g16220 [Camelina sativa]
MKRKSSSPISLINDLILEILSRLPSKSVARFHCVSKLWDSMLGSPYFKELFLTRSSANQRLLFAVHERGVWSFFSSADAEFSSSTTLVADAEFYVKFSPKELKIYNLLYSGDIRKISCGYASGLLYMYGDRYEARPLICNPITGRYAILPDRYTFRRAYSFFGFDPIDKQHKALSMAYPFGPGHHKVLTFGDGDIRWRKVKNSVRHDINSDGVCINGVLYYLGDSKSCTNDDHVITSDYVIVCFNLRSEKFTFINVEFVCTQLINYKGKLAIIFWEGDDYYTYDDTMPIHELHLWVVEDLEKKKWSKYTYTLSADKFFCHRVSVVGATASGEILFSMCEYTPKEPFYVFYFNPERNTLQSVEIQCFGEGFKECCRVLTFLNHVEDLDANDLKLLKSVHPPLEPPEYMGPSDSESD